MRQKAVYSALLSGVLAVSTAFAESPFSQSPPYAPGYSSGVQGMLGSILAAILNMVYWIFGLEFLGIDNPLLVSAFIRFNIWLITFVLVYTILAKGSTLLAARGVAGAPAGALSGVNRTSAAVLAMCVAFLATFNISAATILTIGGIFGLMTALVLISVPFIIVAGAIYLIPSTTRASVAFKICAILLAIILLSLAQPLFNGQVMF